MMDNILHQLVWIGMVDTLNYIEGFFITTGHWSLVLDFVNNFLCQPKLQDFVQYYDSIMPMLKQFVMTATSKKVNRSQVPTPLTSQSSTTCCALTGFWFDMSIRVWIFDISGSIGSTYLKSTSRSPKENRLRGKSFECMSLPGDRDLKERQLTTLHTIRCVY